MIDRVVADMNMVDDILPLAETPGWPFDKRGWRINDEKMREVQRSKALEALDSDKDLSLALSIEFPAREKLEILAEILMEFLSSITDGIVTEDLWAKLDADINARAAKPLTKPEEIKNWVLDSLSLAPNHNISFVFLTSMLSRVAGEIAPVPKNRWRADSVKSSFSMVRRSLSWKGAAPILANDPALARRQEIEKAYVEIFAGLIFRGPPGVKDGPKRVMEERWKGVLEAFLKGEHE